MKPFILVFLGLAAVTNVMSQDSYENEAQTGRSMGKHRSPKIAQSYIWSDTLWGDVPAPLLLKRQSCKNFLPVYFISLSAGGNSSTISPKAVNKTPLLQIKGNIFYDVSYRSHLDTPFLADNLIQHTVQTRLDLLYKGQYPFKIYLTNRFGNSDLFRKYNDIGLHFNSADYLRTAKSLLLTQIQETLLRRFSRVDSLKETLLSLQHRIRYLNNYITRPDITQRRIEERERQYYLQQRSLNQELPTLSSSTDLPTLPNTWAFAPNNDQLNRTAIINKRDSLIATLYNPAGVWVDSTLYYKEEIDSLNDKLNKLHHDYVLLQTQLNDIKADWRNEVEKASDWRSLQAKITAYSISDTVLPKTAKILGSIQSIGIGRSFIDYSDLTVRGLSINGFQVEYNPGNYYAVAVGRLDYRFRDFIVSNPFTRRQSLALFRFGRGYRNGNHVYMTYFTGIRDINNAVTNQTLAPVTQMSGSRLSGLALEAQYKVGRFITVTGEMAKSTAPYYSVDSNKSKNWRQTLFDFNERQNEAYSLWIKGSFPKTETSFSARARYTGSAFQSFSIFTSGASQWSWHVKVNQSLFKKKLSIAAGLQKNDFNNPLLNYTFRSSSTQANVQASFRKRKWPVITLGYFPGSQLTKISNQEYSITQYQTLLASLTYNYKIGSLQVSSNLIGSQFVNHASDTGFLYFNSRNILFNHYFLFPRLTYSIALTSNSSTGRTLNSIENTIQFSCFNWLSVGAGLKYHYGTMTSSPLWGGSSNISLRIKKLGELVLSADKGYLPGPQRNLVENNYGRLTYYINF